jgi:hypothetical protein
MSTTTTPVLRVGVMCLGTTFPAWQAIAIKRLAAVPGVEIALLIVDCNATPGNLRPDDIQERPLRTRLAQAVKDRAVLRKLWGRLTRFVQTYLLWRGASFFHRYWRRTVRLMPCEEPVELSDLLAGVPVIRCRTEFRGRFSQYFSPADLNAIKQYALDLILRFGFGIIRGEILTLPRYGVWSYHHDDHLRYRGGPPGFWEIYCGDKWNGAMLQRLTDKLDDGVIIHKEYFRTILHSYAENLNHLYMESAKWPAQACKALLQGFAQDLFRESTRSQAPIYKIPTNRQMVLYLAKLLMHQVKHHYRDLVGTSPVGKESWAIGIIREPVRNLLTWNTPLQVQWLVPPDGRFFADPFLISKDDVHYIFFEDFNYHIERGHIGVIETRDWLNFSEPRMVLEQPYHLSYPYVFEHDGRFYCTPEQYQSGEVVLYEAERFPDRWVPRAVLLRDFAGLDPTVLQHEGQWWLFLTNQDNGHADNLYLFHADSLFGPWRPHTRNPVRRDSGKVRPGGRPFLLDGRLFRPTQNCTKTYGGSVIINHITALSPSEFEERPLQIELDAKAAWPYAEGLHTLCALGDVTLIDAKRRLEVRNDVRRVLATKARGARRLLGVSLLTAATVVAGGGLTSRLLGRLS